MDSENHLSALNEEEEEEYIEKLINSQTVESYNEDNLTDNLEANQLLDSNPATPVDGSEASDSESDIVYYNEQQYDSLYRDEPNKFDSLCDEVLSSVSFLNSSLSELLQLKDELLHHSLPPPFLLQMTLAISQIFRSSSDMRTPLDELLRMVRLYATPWEQKSSTVRKLHADYETKKAQLNIAIRKLQLVEIHSQRMEKERRIMAWGRLYAKLATTKGHGRQWKFLINKFKKKEKEGPEQLQCYLNDLDTEEEEDNEDVESSTLVSRAANSAAATLGGDKDESLEGEESESEETRCTAFTSPSGRKTGVDSAVYIRPPMKDAECWTETPEYDRWLHIRVYCPIDIDARELKCVVTYKTQYFKTTILDHVVETPIVNEKIEKPKEEPVKIGENKLMKKGGRKRLIGLRAPPPKPAEIVVEKIDRWDEFIIKMPDEEPAGIWKPVTDSGSIPHEPLRVSVHYGPKEELISLATIDMADLNSLDLPVLFLKAPQLNDSSNSENEKDNLSVSEEQLKLQEFQKKARRPSNYQIVDEAPVKKLEPFNFPLYSLDRSQSDDEQKPSGTLPLAFFWTKKIRPKRFEKFTESESLNEIVQDMTGYDMSQLTKEQLHRETCERGFSPFVFSPSPQPTVESASEEVEETIPKSEFDDLKVKHEEEFKNLHNAYEQKLMELVDRLADMEERCEQLEEERVQPRPPSSVRSSSSRPRVASAKSLRSVGLSPMPTPRDRTPISLKPTTPSDNFISVPQIRHHSEGISVQLSDSDSRPLSGVKTFSVPSTISHVIPQSAPEPMVSRLNSTVRTPKNKPKIRKKPPPNIPNWNQNYPTDFLERLKVFEESSRRHKEELHDRTTREISEIIEKKLSGEYKLTPTDENSLKYEYLKDVSLPAIFMPTRGTKMQVFNPRAHQYFHPNGSTEARLTQPPSMLELPSLPKNKMSVLNLFDCTKNFARGGNAVLMMQKYIEQQTDSLIQRVNGLASDGETCDDESRENTPEQKREMGVDPAFFYTQTRSPEMAEID